jgi:hypothetical protein
MTEKRQTSQGYIIRILQHFATKLRNITNFVSDALSSCDEIVAQAYLDQNFTHKGKVLLMRVDDQMRAKLQLSSIFINFYQLSSTFINSHQLLSTHILV